MITITENNVVAQECNMCGREAYIQLSDEELKIYRRPPDASNRTKYS